MSETIVVLGSNSFSGSHFVAAALRAGHPVIGASRSVEPHPVFLPYRTEPGLPLHRFRFMQCDINRHLDRLLEAIEETQAPYVVNFAAQSMVGESWQHPEHWFQTNVTAQVMLHDRLRKLPWLRRYVHVSTPEVYGSTSGTVVESSAYNPSTPYAVSRAAADMSLASFHKAYGFPVVFTRAANVYGPGQQLYRIIPRAALRFLSGGTLQLHGGGHSVRSFIHIADVVDGTLRAMRDGTPGQAYHLSTREGVSIRDLVLRVAELTGTDFDTRVESTGDRLGKDAAYLLDSTRARTELGWSDTHPLQDGLEETVSWVRGNLDVLSRQEQNYIHKP